MHIRSAAERTEHPEEGGLTKRCSIVKIGCGCVAGVTDNAVRVIVMERGEAICCAAIGMAASGGDLVGFGLRSDCFIHGVILRT